MSEKIQVTHGQMMEAMDQLMKHRLAASVMTAFTSEETAMRGALIKRIDDAYNVLLERVKDYTPDP